MVFKLLEEDLTQYYCNRILIPEKAAEILVEIAGAVKSDLRLSDIYKSFYTSYIESGYWMTTDESLTVDPYVQEVLKEHASLFYLHAALEKLPLTEPVYHELGIGEDIFVDTLRDIGVFIQRAYEQTGQYGIKTFSWIWRHLEAKMFRLGRLNFLAVPFQGNVKGFYNAGENALLLLCNSGLELRDNGDMQGVCGKEKTEDGFVTEYHETGELFVGNPVTRSGKGLRHQASLKKSEWEKVLDEGDCVLEIHIPKDGRFQLEDVRESYLQAKAFYKKHFGERNVKGMVCHTWLFTPQLQEMLPEKSNIVKFQRQFYLYPTTGSVKFLWDFVFGEYTEVKDAKPDNSLKEQVLRYIQEGREIFDMRGIYLETGGEFGSVH